MGRIVQTNTRATKGQVTVQYNGDVQNGISECTTRRSLSPMGRRPHRAPLLSGKNKKWLQWARHHKHWTTEEWKTLPGPINPGSCCVMLMAEVQAGGGGVTVWGMFSWHTLGPLIPIEQRFHALKNSKRCLTWYLINWPHCVCVCV